MDRFCENYKSNIEYMDKTLRVDENFDIIKKIINVGKDEMTFYYIDGFINDGMMSKIMIYLVGLKSLLPDKNDKSLSAANLFVRSHMPYVETSVTGKTHFALQMLMSGACVALGSSFGDEVIIIDARTYPARETGEPDGDKVMRGARDGFVETLIFNTASQNKKSSTHDVLRDCWRIFKKRYYNMLYEG